MAKRVCEYCNLDIYEDDKQVLLATISPKSKQESYFHFDCFKKNHDEKVEAKARSIIKEIQSKAVGMLDSIKDIAGNFQGSDQLGSMLGIDLEKEIPKFDEFNVNKKNDKRKKPKRKK